MAYLRIYIFWCVSLLAFSGFAFAAVNMVFSSTNKREIEGNSFLYSAFFQGPGSEATSIDESKNSACPLSLARGKNVVMMEGKRDNTKSLFVKKGHGVKPKERFVRVHAEGLAGCDKSPSRNFVRGKACGPGKATLKQLSQFLT